MAKKKRELPDENNPEVFEAYKKRFIIAGLRRSTLFWPFRNETLKKARVDKGMYLCNRCKKITHRSEVQLDHINPVIKLSGFTNWDDYFNSLFGKSTDFQVLCKPCHNIKTSEETTIRKILRKIKKSQKRYK